MFNFRIWISDFRLKNLLENETKLRNLERKDGAVIFLGFLKAVFIRGVDEKLMGNWSEVDNFYL